MNENQKSPKPLSFSRDGGVVGMRQPGSPAYVWQRDLANCLPLIMKNATILTQLIYEDKKEELEILDTIIQFYHNMYTKSREKNIIGLLYMKEMYKYVREIGEKGTEVFSAFHGFFTLSVFSFLYGSKSMAIVSPDTLDENCYNYHNLITMLSLISQDKRKEFMKEITDNFLIPSNFDFTGILSQADNYLDTIKANQKERYKNNERNFERSVEDDKGES